MTRHTRLVAAADQVAGARRQKNPKISIGAGVYGVICPECGAFPRQYCRSGSGEIISEAHDSRVIEGLKPVGYDGFRYAYGSHNLRDSSTKTEDSGGLWTRQDSGITWHKAGGGWRRAGHRPNPGRQAFITDFGESPVLMADDGTELRLGRYGVWKWNGRKHEVVDQGDDLEELRARHGIMTEVILLRSP